MKNLRNHLVSLLVTALFVALAVGSGQIPPEQPPPLEQAPH